MSEPEWTAARNGVGDRRLTRTDALTGVLATLQVSLTALPGFLALLLVALALPEALVPSAPGSSGTQTGALGRLGDAIHVGLKHVPDGCKVGLGLAMLLALVAPVAWLAPSLVLVLLGSHRLVKHTALPLVAGWLGYLFLLWCMLLALD
jgi:hypothetical protein